MGFRLSNVIGAPFKDFVSQQLTTRVARNGGNALNTGFYNRSPDEVLYLANKTSWASLKSSVNVSPEYAKELQQYYTEEDGFNQSAAINEGLAANWILQAGTSKTTINPAGIYTNGLDLRSGLGLDGAYGLGGITDQGYRPMPGLESVTIETAGKLGSLRYATINFRVWNMNQLDVIDALYFRLGFTMLLEWGHTLYFRNEGITLEKGNEGIDGFFGKKVIKEQIQYSINNRVKQTHGNYDGMLGVVTNFNYSFNQDGGWDCSIKLVGLGNIIETQKINSQYDIPSGATAIYKKAQKALNQRLQQLQQQQNQKQADDKKKDEEKRYNDEIANFEKKNPIKDLPTLYKALSGGRTDLDLTNDTSVDILWTNSVVTPFFAASEDIENQFINDKINYPRYAPGYVVLVNGVAKFYPAFVKKGLQAPNTGFRYWLESGQGWKIDQDRLNAFVSFISDRTLGSGLWPNNDQTGTSLNPQKTLAGAFFEAIQRGRTKTVNENQMGVTIEGEYDIKKGSISPDIQVTYGGSNITRKAEIKDRSSSNRWTFEFKLQVNTNLDRVDRGVYAAALNNALIGADGLSGQWTLAKIENQGAVAKNQPYQIEILLTRQITLENLSGYYRANSTQLISNGSATLTISIRTNIVSILDELVAPTGDLGVVTPPDPSKWQIQASSADTSKQTTEAPLSSALEAMLTIIQYSAISETAKKKGQGVKEIPIKTITQQLLSSLTKAPLANLFRGTVNLNAPTSSLTNAQDIFSDPYSLGIKGYNTALISGQTNGDPLQHYKDVPTVNFEKLMKAYVVPLEYTDSSISSESAMAALMETPVYISMGYLLFFINNVCLLYDDTVTPDTQPGPNEPARPHFYIDFNPETNLCLTIPSQLSIDPTVCLIPRSGQQEDYELIFKAMGIGDPTKIPNLYDIGANDRVSGALPSFKTTGANSRYQGQTMNILLNTQYLLDLVRDTSDRDNHNNVHFRPFMDRILADVNKALGDVNAFRLGYVDESNTAVIFDDQFVPNKDSESNILRRTSDHNRYILPIYGLDGMARSLSYETNISTKMSSLIAIGARGTTANSGSTQSSDASGIMKLSEGLQDRVIKRAEDVAKLAGATTQSSGKKPKDNKLELAKQFNEHVKSIYGIGKVDRMKIAPSKNYLIQALTSRKALDQGTNSSPIIPLNLNVTLDGISGINMGNVFLIPQERTPKSLRGMSTFRFGYMVVGLTHQIQENTWTTAIRGQLIRLRDEDSYKEGGPKPKIGTTPPGGTPSNTPCGDVTNRNIQKWKNLPYVNYQQTTVSMKDVRQYLRYNYPNDVAAARAAYAIIYIESGQGSKGINNNYIGLQTDGGGFISTDTTYVKATTSVVDSGGQCRAFGVYENWQGCADHAVAIMKSRAEKSSSNRKMVPSNENNAAYFSKGYAKNWVAPDPTKTSQADIEAIEKIGLDAYNVAIREIAY